MSKTLQIRIDDTMKAAIDELFSSLGMDTSTAVRIFFAAALECGGIPFPVQRATAFPGRIPPADAAVDTATRAAAKAETPVKRARLRHDVQPQEPDESILATNSGISRIDEDTSSFIPSATPPRRARHYRR
jgi:addiction module RelB/DinJ family antitoxin